MRVWQFRHDGSWQEASLQDWGDANTLEEYLERIGFQGTSTHHLGQFGQVFGDFEVYETANDESAFPRFVTWDDGSVWEGIFIDDLPSWLAFLRYVQPLLEPESEEETKHV